MRNEVACCYLSGQTDATWTENEFCRWICQQTLNDFASSSYLPFICNSQSLACRSTLLLALISRLLSWPLEAVLSKPSSRLSANSLSSLTVHATPPGCRLQPGPHRAAPPPARSWRSRQGQRVRLFQKRPQNLHLSSARICDINPSLVFLQRPGSSSQRLLLRPLRGHRASA